VFHLSDYDAQTRMINENIEEIDSSLFYMIEPYKSTLNETMQEIVAEAIGDFSKAQPESTLGNLVADATRVMASVYLNEDIDIGIVNYGGIRIPTISKGNITLRNVFELMPFDNYLVVVEVTGVELKTIISRIAAYGGWPVSGLSFNILEDRTYADVLINNQPLDLNEKYKIALSDYIANGGDKMGMLTDLKQINTNKLLRDAFIDYFRKEKKLIPILEGRITIQQ
jgi:2',3'-cyclic-nucleotide 2'-phosphodiesterase (5'-nucleotidase family)